MDNGLVAPDEGLIALLAGYAAGALPPPLHVLVESHLALTPTHRAYVAGLEACAGVMIDDDTPKPLADRDQRLAAIFGLTPEGVDDRPRNRLTDPVFPEPLRRFIGQGSDTIGWRNVIPGLREMRIGQSEASLLCVAAGRKMPSHTHEGSEYTLVLSGAFSDKTGHYRRGDIAIGDQTLDHQPIADSDEDCICFVVNDAPLRLTGPFGRIYEAFRRLR